MINWIFYPKSKRPPEIVFKVVSIFKEMADKIDSRSFDLKSNQVLGMVSTRLQEIGFRVEKSSMKEDRIEVPVLFGRNGRLDKAFRADAYNEKECFVFEVEAGRGVLNYQFLKDLFQACMMSDVKYLGLAVRNIYKNSNDFDTVETFFETLYASNRLQLPLDGVLLIGY